MEIELNNEQTTPSQQQEQRKASHDLAAARLVKSADLSKMAFSIEEDLRENYPVTLVFKMSLHLKKKSPIIFNFPFLSVLRSSHI